MNHPLGATVIINIPTDTLSVMLVNFIMDVIFIKNKTKRGKNAVSMERS